ncbi:MAG: DUF4416 family protein [Candidatus Marinimicrobia bacterium]|nr:DUF4416 family protein [Candidatus Neomarinimicrobiota bacterium]MDD5583305.1 DUF4416 family protein [Candidatus Neomarinimicrobiota bacterium]
MEAQGFKPVKLFIAILYNETANPDIFVPHLARIFSPIDYRSTVYSFKFTHYYEQEMGGDLSRILISFQNLIPPDSLAEIKQLTRVIESKYSDERRRTINLDPGYVDLDKVVLASAKYGRQKIPLYDGIYADPTLEFTRQAFRPFRWTFPDFSTGLYHEDLKHIRLIYKHQLRTLDW